MANNEINVRPNLQQSQLPASTQLKQVGTGNENVEHANSSAAIQRAALEKVQEKKEAENDPANKNELNDELDEKVAQLNDHMQNLHRNLQFKVDEDSGETVVKVIDSETDEIVRQIPSQEVLDARHAIDKVKGILLEERA
jgi:flagellar protein FlaG